MYILEQRLDNGSWKMICLDKDMAPLMSMAQKSVGIYRTINTAGIWLLESHSVETI